ncbi:hypothetical protein [Catellatospora sp. NPDC049609]|uniref:hypothetical protein n=1 Tax=Catellatospora sp. NPDC049609 TaxID=3155505 RepID=UPI003426DEBC
MAHEDEHIRLLLTGAVPPLTAPEDRVGEVGRRVGRRRRRLLGTGALALILAVGLAAGGARALTGPPVTPVEPGATADPLGWTSCDEAVPGRSQDGFAVPAREAAAFARLTADARPVAVVICEVVPQPRTGGGEELVLRERQGPDIGPLVTALRLPDEPKTGGGCRTDLVPAPWLAMLDAEGRWTRPGIPLDRCDKPRGEVGTAIAAMRLTTMSVWPIRVVESPEDTVSGCDRNWKDMFAWDATGRPAPDSGTLARPFPAGQEIRLCVFEARQDGGDLVYGRVLAEDRRAAVEQALLAAGPVAPCYEHADRIAVLRSVQNNNPTTYVELDGCYRIRVTGYGEPGFAQGDPALAGLLGRS